MSKHSPRALALLVCLALVAALMAHTAPVAEAQQPDLVINEIVAANDTYVDNFGGTPDWIELQNDDTTAIDLAGWTITDNGATWTMPSVVVAPGARVLLFASGRDLPAPQMHTNFSLKRNGETLLLAAPNGSLVDSVTYPELDDDQSYGHGLSGGIGYLLAATPGAANSELAPSSVSIVTPAQRFQNSLEVSLAATTRPGETVRYSTDGSAVTASSPTYDQPFTITASTVVRAAVVGNGVVGPESRAGYTAVSSSIASFSSDIPIVIIHSTGRVGESNQDAIVTIIDRGIDGRATIFGDADYSGFGGVRLRGATSINFPKKQYKLELWGDLIGEEVDANLLGLGSDSDWTLYAPGRYDRAMINNPFMYELGKRVGVLAPDYQFVELYIEDNQTQTVGDGDYQGLYLLRETIKIADNRVDITKHTPTSAGPDGGYIIRYDWADSCCVNIEGHPDFGSQIAIDSPGAASLTNSQETYIDDWWDQLQAASATSFSAADQYLDFDSIIDHWLLEILAMDVDVLRASHFMHKDANGQLLGGPLWDFDRSMGAADSRVNQISEAEAWEPNGSSGHSYESDIYWHLWNLPEVQARLRSRWTELRAADLSDTSIGALITELGDEIAEAYVREDARWGSVSPYGSRYGDLTGELNHMRDWLFARTAWLDDQFSSSTSAPIITLDANLDFEENVPFNYQVQAVDAQPIIYSASGLPEGLTIDSVTGIISGTVAYGDGYRPYTTTVTVTDSNGAASSAETLMTPLRPYLDNPPAVVLNEYNGVAPGRLLGNGGSDITFGQVTGNGGDWFEVLIVEDELDMRGWQFDLWSKNDAGTIVQTAALTLGQDDLLSNMRAGSLMTVAESVPDDLSYNPAAGDWILNLQANAAGDGALFSDQSDFDTNHTRWRLVVRDDTGAIRGFIGGETVAFQDFGFNLADDEVFALRGVPDQGLGYFNIVDSTFGAENPQQDLSGLRPTLVTIGDVSCDDAVNIADALVVVQYTVGLRTDSGGCPMIDFANQINLAGGDVNNDSVVNVADALLIGQCTVGITNQFCP